MWPEGYEYGSSQEGSGRYNILRKGKCIHRITAVDHSMSGEEGRMEGGEERRGED